MNVKLVVILVLSSVAMIFLVQNVRAVEVTFLFWSIAMSGAILIFFTFVMGFALGWFLHSYLAYRKSKETGSGGSF